MPAVSKIWCGDAARLGVAVVAASILAATAVGAEGLTPWRQGNVQPKGDAGFWYMAAEGGFAKAEGLDLKMFGFQNDPLILKALLARELDTFEGSPISSMIAGSKGADVKILGCTWPKLTYSIYTHADIRSLADLKGKTVGISAPGSLPDLVARTMLRQAGVPPGAVKFVMAGSDAERLAAVMAKTIDAGVSTSDFAARPGLNVRTLARANEVLPQFLRSCIITRGDMVRDKPDLLVRLLTAEMKALGYAVKNRDAVVELAHKITGMPASDPTPGVNFDEVIAQNAVSPTLEIDMAKMIWLRNLLAEDGRLDPTFDPARLIDTSLREKALQRVGQGG